MHYNVKINRKQTTIHTSKLNNLSVKNFMYDQLVVCAETDLFTWLYKLVTSSPFALKQNSIVYKKKYKLKN